jgi:hypothetical protein
MKTEEIQEDTVALNWMARRLGYKDTQALAEENGFSSPQAMAIESGFSDMVAYFTKPGFVRRMDKLRKKPTLTGRI